MQKRTVLNEEDIQKLEVKLPVLFGKQAHEYILALWSAGIVAILFVVLVLPGIIYPGAHVEIQSDAPGSSVLIDGIRVGSTPHVMFLPTGPHTLVVRQPGLLSDKRTVDVPRQLVGSLFVLGRTTIVCPQTMPDPEQYFRIQVKEFSRSSMSNPDTVKKSYNYQVPSVLSQAVNTFAAIQQRSATLTGAKSQVSINTRDAQLLLDVMYACAPHVANSVQAEDWMAAWKLLGSKLSVSEANTERATAIFSALSDTGDNLKKLMSAHGLNLAVNSQSSLPAIRMGGTTRIADRTFTAFNYGGRSGFIGNSEVDEALFSEFLSAHPQWHVEALPELLQQELAGREYLETFTYNSARKDISRNRPIREVSFYAAQQFATWFGNTQLSRTMQQEGYRASLPSHEFWLALDTSAKSRNGPWLIKDKELALDYSFRHAGVESLRGGVFEWSVDTGSFHPVINGASPDSIVIEQATHRFPGFQQRLLGGSLSMAETSFDPHAMYAQPADWCSPYTGFRLVILKD